MLYSSFQEGFPTGTLCTNDLQENLLVPRNLLNNVHHKSDGNYSAFQNACQNRTLVLGLGASVEAKSYSKIQLTPIHFDFRF